MSLEAKSFGYDKEALLGDRRSLTPSKGERQRRAILHALKRLLAVRPLGDLSVGEIAAEAGVGRSGFYVYFESKYAPMAVITCSIWEELMIRAQAFNRLDKEPVAEFLDRGLNVAMEVWREHEAVLIASIQAIPLDAQLADLWSSWNDRLSEILTRQVLRDRENDVARPASSDVPALVETLHEMTQHAFYLDRLHKCDQDQTRRTLETIRAIWMASAWGITTP